MSAFFRFAITGVTATLTHVLIFVALVELLATAPVIANVPAFFGALLVSYGLNYHWTFGSSGEHGVMLPRYVVVALIGLGLNIGITFLVVNVGGYWYGYALAAVVIIVPLFTFLVSKGWVFNSAA
jgi:putative flippase GtrA